MVLVEDQIRVTDCPVVTLVGLTEIVTVGVAGVGVGLGVGAGVGVGVVFPAQSFPVAVL